MKETVYEFKSYFKWIKKANMTHNLWTKNWNSDHSGLAGKSWKHQTAFLYNKNALFCPCQFFITIKVVLLPFWHNFLFQTLQKTLWRGIISERSILIIILIYQSFHVNIYIPSNSPFQNMYVFTSYLFSEDIFNFCHPQKIENCH